MEGKKILIVDDEKDIVDMLAYNFESSGMQVSKAHSGQSAIEAARKVIPHIVLLDVMLPDIDGIEVCEQLRKEPLLKNCLIVFLSARGEDYSQVAGYRAGADDYVVKPVNIKILLHKIKVLLGRTSPSSKDRDQSSLSIDPEKYSVLQKGEETIIPKKEFELLALLMSVPDKVFRRQEILNDVWGSSGTGDRTIDVHIRKLREKFGNNVIQTIKGVGYRFRG